MSPTVHQCIGVQILVLVSLLIFLTPTLGDRATIFATRPNNIMHELQKFAIKRVGESVRWVVQLCGGEVVAGKQRVAEASGGREVASQ